jgi:hypothetical protein
LSQCSGMTPNARNKAKRSARGALHVSAEASPSKAGTQGMLRR